MSSFLVARAYRLQIVRLNAAGYPIGFFDTPDAPVAGTTYPSYMCNGIVKFEPNAPTYDEVYVYSGEQLLGRRQVGVTDYGIGKITLAKYDETVNKLAGGSAIDTSTLTGWSITAPNSNNHTPPRLGLIFSAGATPDDSSENFVNILVSNVTLEPAYFGADQTTGKNPNNLVYNVKVSTSLRTLLGELFSATALGVANDTDTEIRMYGPAPLVLSTYVDDGSATTRLWPYTPYATDHTNVLNSFVKQGVDAHASVSGISGKTVTFTAGSSGNIWIDGFPVALKNIA